MSDLTVPLQTADFLLGRMIATAQMNEKLQKECEHWVEMNKSQGKQVQELYDQIAKWQARATNDESTIKILKEEIKKLRKQLKEEMS